MSFTTLFMAVVALSVVVPVILGITTRRAIRRTHIASTTYLIAGVRPNGAVSQLMERSRVTLATPGSGTTRSHSGVGHVTRACSPVPDARPPAQVEGGPGTVARAIQTGKLLPFDRPAQRRA